LISPSFRSLLSGQITIFAVLTKRQRLKSPSTTLSVATPGEKCEKRRQHPNPASSRNYNPVAGPGFLSGVQNCNVSNRTTVVEMHARILEGLLLFLAGANLVTAQDQIVEELDDEFASTQPDTTSQTVDLPTFTVEMSNSALADFSLRPSKASSSNNSPLIGQTDGVLPMPQSRQKLARSNSAMSDNGQSRNPMCSRE
jgi:hypothetical protein